ncbi:MAG TPA: hypothetical protein VM242_07935 [Acidimicrobiales bacterium]|nr:hypothetical protein [Acidimicrobiales bacterium]
MAGSSSADELDAMENAVVAKTANRSVVFVATSGTSNASVVGEEPQARPQ